MNFCVFLTIFIEIISQVSYTRSIRSKRDNVGIEPNEGACCTCGCCAKRSNDVNTILYCWTCIKRPLLYCTVGLVLRDHLG